MPIRAVLWDVDDTIFDYATADRTGVLEHLRAEGLLGGGEAEEVVLGRWWEVTEIYWARLAAKEVDFEGQRRGRVRAFLGEEASDAEADAWFARYLRHYEAAWALFPDAVPALDGLTPGYRHGVLSNSRASNQDRKLRVLGVRDRFEVLVCAHDLGISKPEAGAFIAACEALGLEPGEVAYVGDKIDIDACGARDAGLTGIWLDRGGAPGAAPGGLPAGVTGVHRITGLDQLSGLLRGDTRFGAPTSIG
ncbi:HAD family hydrolase [Streptomyces sp. NPDC050610]|uniref:HAD family hydrolase n=1 Tax=Streptomyces sp. NPDC050610 TaxID=3157097 RepID=UPI00344A6267